MFEEGMTGIGRYKSKGFIHLDNRVLPRGRTRIAIWGAWGLQVQRNLPV